MATRISKTFINLQIYMKFGNREFLWIAEFEFTVKIA